MSRVLYIIIYIALLSVWSLPANSQDYADNNVTLLLDQAEQDYDIGRFDQCIDAVRSHMNSFQGDQRQKALRLLALCYLAQDNEKQAEHYAVQLVELNNYYSHVDDPIRFQEMVNRLKGGRTITTASSVAEGLEEAPVPVTIITAEMIENLGYNKNLSHLLATYVPGMTDVQAEWEENIAMHGAFARNQELILVMENGHRLNNRTYNSCSLDYALSTEKIDRIEVLRGPASSLYGNVALSAVVNIITKQGADLNGIKAKYGYGTFNTHKADLTMGTTFMEADVFAWGSFYQSDGQGISIGEEWAERYKEHFNLPAQAGYYALADRYRDKPCYDVGMTMRYKDFNILFSHKNSRSVSQFSDDKGLYRYDRYRYFDDVKPGANQESNHVELGYSHQLGSVTLAASVYGDWYNHIHYKIFDPLDPEDEALPEEEQVYTHGFFSTSKIREHTLGGNLRANTNYRLGSMTGNLLLGSQFEHYTLSEHTFIDGEKYEEVVTVSKPSDNFNNEGRENSLSFFAQDKHSFTQKLIFNAGLRFDHKQRRLQSNITAWSPRLALIYLANKAVNLKLTYARSFVDMSYDYRSERTYAEQGYLPQYLTAIQFSVMGKLPALNLSYDVNFSYNKYENLFCNRETSEKTWNNEGSYENLALEASAFWNWQRLTANITFYWCKALRASYYFFSDEEKRVACVPNHTINLNIGWKAVESKRHQLKLYGNLQYTGNILVQRFIFDENANTFVNGDYFLKRRAILDVGVKYTYNKHISLALDCENVFNTDRYVVGPAWSMYPNYLRGRNLMTSISFKL